MSSNLAIVVRISRTLHRRTPLVQDYSGDFARHPVEFLPKDIFMQAHLDFLLAPPTL